MWTISLPLSVPISKNKAFTLNLNPYRNAHYQTLDRAKKSFEKLVRPKLNGIPKLSRLTLEYVLYPGTRQLCDVNNICTIQDKFFSDTLVAHGVIDDDNYNFIADSRFRFGGIDRGNPRVEVVIRSPDHIPTVPPEVLEEGSEDMKISQKTSAQISLTKDDVIDALKAFLRQHIAIAQDADVQFAQMKDGSYEIRIEQDAATEFAKGSDVTVPSTGSKAPRGGKAPRMEPKEAMQALHAKAAPASPQALQGAEAAPSLPVTGEERGHVQPAESSSAAQVVASLPPPTEPMTGIGGSDNGPSQGGGDPAPAPPPKGPSLFSSFKRPQNPS